MRTLKIPQRFARPPLNKGGVSVWLILLTIFLTLSAHALPEDKNQPIHITADTAHMDKSRTSGYFQGHVKVTQGTNVLNCDKLNLFFDKNNHLLKAVATGKETRYQTVTDPKKPPFIATAQEIHYLPPESKIILMGNAKAVQGPNSYTAEHIDYYIDRQMVISPVSKNSRTTIVIAPHSFQQTT